MSWKLLKNIIFLFVINIVIKPMWVFGIDIPAQNIIGKVAFGQYASLLSLSLIFQIILDLGLQTYQTRQVGSNTQSIQWLLPNSIIAKSILSLIYMTVLLSVGWILDYSDYLMYLLFLLGISQVFNSLMLYLRASISSLHYYITDSIISVIEKLVVIIICGSIIYQIIDIPFQIEHLIYGQIIGYSLSGLICCIFILKHTRINWHLIQLKKIKMILKKSYIYAVLILVMAIFFRVDIVILEKLTENTTEAGYYWEVYRLLDMMNNFIGVLFAGLYFPMVMKYKKNKEKIIQLTHTGLHLLVPISLSVLIFSYFFQQEVMQLLYPEHAYDNANLLFFMMMSLPFYSLNYIYSTLLSGLGEIRSQIFHALFCGVLIIVFNIFFIDKYGAAATAVISCIGHFTFFILNYIRAQKTMKTTELFPVSSLLKFLLYMIFIIAFCLLLEELDVELLLKIICIVLVSLAGLFVLKIVQIKSILSMVREKE